MENINKYIGIPYEFAGSSFNGLDCVGLLRLFFKEHHWKPDIYDGVFQKDWYKTTPLRMIKFFCRNFSKIRNVDDLMFGDIVYFHINGEGHCAIYLEYGKILTTFPDKCKQWDGTYLPSRTMIVHRNIWEQGFKGGFRRD